MCLMCFMTIREALNKRIPRVRKPEWNKFAYLRLPLTENNTYSAWAELYDRPSQEALGKEVGKDRLLIMNLLNEEGWEKFEGEKDEAEVYLES